MSTRPLHRLSLSVSLHSWIGLLLSLVLFAPCARAANPVTMEVGSPLAWNDKPLSIHVKVGRWFPVAVTLTNSGEAVAGRLTLRLTASGGQTGRQSVFFSEVDLPSNARKRIWLYGRVDGEQFDGASVTFSARGLQTLEAAIPLQTSAPGTRVVVTISDTGENLSFLSGLNDRSLGIAEELNEEGAYAGRSAIPSQRGFVRPLGASREMVPDRWVGLESADMVVLGDFAHSALSPAQIAALRGYVTGGGALLMIGGANWQRLAQSPLSELWPVSPTGSGAATVSEVRELVKSYLSDRQALSGADRLGGAPVLVTRGALRPNARLLAGTARNALLASRSFGAGYVIYTAMDPTNPPFMGWRGNVGLWSNVFRETQRPHRLESIDPQGLFMAPSLPPGMPPSTGDEPPRGSGPTGDLLNAMRRLPQLQTPATSAIAWFLALYVFCLVPVNYFALRWFDKRELAWVTVPIIALAFSAMSYATARSIKGTDLLTCHVNIVQSAGDSGVARADSMLWIYSPRRASYTISSENPNMAMGDYVLGGMDAVGGMTVREPGEGAFRIEDTDVKMWSEAQFIGEGLVDAGRGVTVQASGRRLIVQNRTPFDLHGAVLVTGEKAIAQVRRCGETGEIKAGTSAEAGPGDGIALSDPRLKGRIEDASNLNQLFGRETANTPASTTPGALASQALSIALGSNLGSSNPVALLVAWSKSPVAALTIQDEEPRAENVTLFVFRLPSLSQRAQAQEAVVQPTAYAPLDPDVSNRATALPGMSWTYDCVLPDPQALQGGRPGKQPILTLHVDGAWRTVRRWMPVPFGRPRWPVPAAPLTVPLPHSPPAQIALHNFALHRWQPVTGHLYTDARAHVVGLWRWKGRISGTPFIRQPDGLIRLRINSSDSDIRIHRVQLTATP
jgi:hypothetical protein